MHLSKLHRHIHTHIQFRESICGIVYPESMLSKGCPKVVQRLSASCPYLHGTARHGTARHGTARHGTARHGTARHGTARHGTARHGTARHGTARHGTARHGTARHGTARHGTARHGTARHGTARHGTARHGTARHGTARHGITVYCFPAQLRNILIKIAAIYAHACQLSLVTSTLTLPVEYHFKYAFNSMKIVRYEKHVIDPIKNLNKVFVPILNEEKIYGGGDIKIRYFPYGNWKVT